MFHSNENQSPGPSVVPDNIMNYASAGLIGLGVASCGYTNVPTKALVNINKRHSQKFLDHLT